METSESGVWAIQIVLSRDAATRTFGYPFEPGSEESWRQATRMAVARINEYRRDGWFLTDILVLGLADGIAVPEQTRRSRDEIGRLLD